MTDKTPDPCGSDSSAELGDIDPKCACGDRVADKCPGEWEPGCNLGQNANSARRCNPQVSAQINVALGINREPSRTLTLTGDENTPPLPLTEAQVNHLRRLLAWMRCEWTLDEDMQRGYLSGASEGVRLGITTEEQASEIVQQKAEQINQCPAYVRQAVKMLTKALRGHETKAGIVDNSELPNTTMTDAKRAVD